MHALLILYSNSQCAVISNRNIEPWAYRAGRGSSPSLLGKQSQSGNIRFTVGQYWLIIKINGANSVNFVGNSVNFGGNMLSNRNFS